MHDPVPPDLHVRIRQAFLLGLARQPVAPPPSLTGLLPPGSEPAVALLALTGQRQRFAGAPAPVVDPVPDAARRLHEDPRPILPPPARRALSRLAGSVEKPLAGSVLPIALRRIGAAGCRPHPFDLPDLARHIKADADNLGLAERAYLALIASDADDEATKGLFFDRITAENWTTFPKAQRRMFVAGVRRDNSAEGRALIESVWKTEPAPVRAALLEALAVGLGADDKPFLDRLATDRADSVKQAAQRLLARMPSDEGFAQRVAEAAQWFKRAGKGVGRVMAALGMGGEGALTFMPPGGKSDLLEVAAARTRLFTRLPLDTLAKAVGVTPADIVAALPENEMEVLWLLLETAREDGDIATVQCIVRTCLLTSRAFPGQHIASLAAGARLPLDPEAATRFVTAPTWKNVISGLDQLSELGVKVGVASGTASVVPKDDGRLIFTATLMPREAMPAFVASLAPLHPLTARAAKDFADLILALPA
jgi:hypothetical protein